MKLAFLAAVVFCLPLQAQKATELFIPIGRSPGLSSAGKTIIGTVTKIDGLKISVGEKAIQLTDSTRIYLDRSAVKKTNTLGSKSDVQVGAFIEAFESSWLKVRAE